MLKKILLDSTEFHFSDSHLPALIHGKENEGSSLFTISMLADLHSQGLNVVALTGFAMASDELYKQIGEEGKDRVAVFVKEQTREFLDFIQKQNDTHKRVVLVQNIELFEKEVLDAVRDFEKLVIAGDISKCSYKESLLSINFATKIYFSKLDQSLPPLQQYEGYLSSTNTKGTISVEV